MGLTVLDPVDQPLGVFNPQADGERLGFHQQLPGSQRGVGVPGTVTDRQHQMAADQFVAIIAPGSGHLAIAADKVGEAGGEADVTAALLQVAADGSHNSTQAVGADMGLGLVADFRRCAELHELLQHPGRVGVPQAAGQFAVGKGTGPAFSELDVALLIQCPISPEGGYILYPLFHRSAPFQQGHGNAVRCQSQRTEKSCRPHAYYHDRFRMGRGAKGQQRFGRKTLKVR